MTVTRFFADMRKQKGDSRQMIDMIRDYCSQSGGSGIGWLVRADQAMYLLPSDSIFGQANQFDQTCVTRLGQYISQQQNASDGAFCVLSWDSAFLMLVKEAAGSAENVRGVHLSTVITAMRAKGLVYRGLANGPTTPIRLPLRSGVSASFVRPGQAASVGRLNRGFDALPLDQAIVLAKDALRGMGHVSRESALSLKDLRPMLCSLDSRAAKQLGDYASEKLITNVVASGVREGWLTRFRLVPDKSGTEAIFLNVTSQTVLPSPTQSTPEKLMGQASNLGDAGLVQQSFPVNGDGLIKDNSEPQPRRHPNRATEYEAILTALRIGGLPETRERIFNAIEQVVTENKEGLPLLEVFSKAGERARKDAESECYRAERNWPVALICARRLMLKSGVLSDPDGIGIVDKIGSTAKRVARIASDFRMVCEGVLIEHIIDKLGGINYDDDTYYVGLTLYRKGKERAVPPDELKAKVDAILQHLEETGRVVMDQADRVIRTTNKSIHAVRAAAS